MAHLRHGKHVNRGLQADFDKWGEASIRLRLLERADKPELREREQDWIDRLLPVAAGMYNVRPASVPAFDTRSDELRLRHASRLMCCPKYALEILINKGLVQARQNDVGETVVTRDEMRRARSYVGYSKKPHRWLLKLTLMDQQRNHAHGPRR